MLLLTLACAVLAGLMIAVVALWQRRARPSGDGAQGALGHEKALYAAFVADVDRRLASGDLDEDQALEERAEAGRALLRAGETSAVVPPLGPLGVLGGAAAIAVVAFGLYLFVGHPTLPDAPFQSRLKQWNAVAARDPESLPPEVIAIILRQGEARDGKDPGYWLLRGRMDMIAGQTYQGLKDYRRALDLSPKTFTAWSELGEAVTLRMGTVDAEARQAFEAALALDAGDSRAHYYLGKQAVTDGKYDLARTHFNAALAAVPVSDVRHSQIAHELDEVGPAQAAGEAANARIRSMVAALDASLKADPDNADGWSRLLRSYTVLGDTAAHDRAVAAVKAHFPPEKADAIIAKSSAAVGAENTGGM